MIVRIPTDPRYTALLGTGVYVFAYYEWALIYLIQHFKPGFVSRYCRGAPLTSGRVKQELDAILEDPATDYTKASRAELEACRDRFKDLIEKRNALLHAHPATDADGAQLLVYQTRSDRPLPDMKWSPTAIEQAVGEFDSAACEATTLLHRLLGTSAG